LGINLNVKIVDFTLELTLLCLFSLEFLLKLCNLFVKLSLLAVERVNFKLQFFLVRRGNVELLNGDLNILESSALLLLEELPFLLIFDLKASLVALQLVLIKLIELELHQVELALFLLSRQLQLLLFAFGLGFILLSECFFILTELPSPLPLKPLFLSSMLRIKLLSIFADLRLEINLKLLTVLRQLSLDVDLAAR
jgi:hypothetical protein